MRNFVKFLLWLLAGVSILTVVLFGLLMFVDVNLFRAQIEKQVSNAFGREVVFEGPLTLEPSLMPRFAVRGLKIANPTWASRPYLATVEKFDIRVSLLPLLNGNLEIISLEFHGVDLLLEATAEGQNNFTFGETAKPAEPFALPAIARMTLHNAKIGYSAPVTPLRSLQVERVTARKVPSEPLELEAQTKVNTVPVTVLLRAEALGEVGTDRAWKAALRGEIGKLRLRIEGNIRTLGAWDQGNYQVHVEGPHLDDLEKMTGYPLPDAESYELDATVGFDLNDYLTITEFTASIGDSDLHGSLDWDIDAPRPKIAIRLASQHLDIDDMGLDDTASDDGRIDAEFWDQPLDPSLFAFVDLDIKVKVGKLVGPALSVQDVAFSLYADNQDIRLASTTANLAGGRIAAHATFPWGERIKALEPDGLSLRTLFKHTEFDARAEAIDTNDLYSTSLMDRPLALSLASMEMSARPDMPLVIKAKAAINDEPISIKLRGEALAELVQRPVGPWRKLALELRGDDIRLDASGSVARPLDVGGIDIEFALSGRDLHALLPLRGGYSLRGRYRDQPGRHLIDALQLRIGASDLGGRFIVQHDGQRPMITARLESNRLQLDKLIPEGDGDATDRVDFDRSFDIGELSASDLDIELRIKQLEGLAMPVRDILLRARADGRSLRLGPVRALVDGTQIDGSTQWPWGHRLANLGKRGLSIRRLAQHADLALQARLPDRKLRYQTEMLGQVFTLELTSVEAAARPGDALNVTARAQLNDKPVQASLRAEPLAALAQRPFGPWHDLATEIKAGDIRFKATGSVERPLEGSGFDIRYKLNGSEIDTLLPWFDLMLPLEGAYSVSGHFADLPDRIVLDDLEVTSGQSDIGGKLTVYHKNDRPRVEGELHSDQIYLNELIPVNEARTSADTQNRLIPEYHLPIESLQAIDIDAVFNGKRLRTKFGDLGYINFNISLQDGRFRLAPFRVRGWAGSRIDADVTIDAAQDPPLINGELIARDLDYGLVLRQAGVAEIVEGHLDVTLRLSGSGRTRRELLANADGQLVVVGKDGRIASRRLDLWGSSLVTTMLSRDWRSADVTQLNCLVVRVSIEDGVAISDDLLVDTQRITIGAAGSLDLETEELNLVFAPRPKRASLISLTNPVQVTGTMAEPRVSVTVLPGRRMAAAGGGVLAGLVNPAYMVFLLSSTGSAEANTCVAAVNTAMEVKGESQGVGPLETEPPARFSPFPGCSPRFRR